MADAAGEEDPDDAFGFGSKVRQAGGGCPVGRVIGTDDAIVVEHGSKGESCESHADVGEKPAALNSAAGGTGLMSMG